MLLQTPLRELDEAIVASSVEDLMASLPVLTLPLYTIITTPGRGIHMTALHDGS